RARHQRDHGEGTPRPSDAENEGQLGRGFGQNGRKTPPLSSGECLILRRVSSSTTNPGISAAVGGGINAPETSQSAGLVIGPVLIVCVAANAACNRFRDRHRRERCCYFWRPGHAPQPEHRVETRRAYGLAGQLSYRRPADGKLFCSRGERGVPNTRS